MVDVRSGRRVWLDPGERGEYYVPRLYWTSRPDTLALITLNRPQNVMRLYFFDVRTGGKRLVMSDSSRTWIDVYDFYASVDNLMTFPVGAAEFFWLSDRDGWQHIYRYDYAGRLLNQVTRGRWSVTRIEGIDPKTRTIYYTGTEASPLQRQLSVIRFDGSGARRLTATRGTHAIDMSPDTRYYLDRWSATNQTRQVELWTTAGRGRMLKKLEDNGQRARDRVAHDPRLLPRRAVQLHHVRLGAPRRLPHQAAPLRLDEALPRGLRDLWRARLAASVRPVRDRRLLAMAGAAGLHRRRPEQPGHE
ncbi:MAG: hypothetical protein DMD71_07400 [Gemmatimonadetes bacterium]|nr:MAG: hypothetical protein DMD71_07400 [Gemmatimonadota bacterium]